MEVSQFKEDADSPMNESTNSNNLEEFLNLDLENIKFAKISGPLLMAIGSDKGWAIAFAHLYQTYEKKVHFFTVKYLLLRGCEDPNNHVFDITQETWINCNNYLAKLFGGRQVKDIEQPYAWLITISINICKRHLAKETKFASVQLDDFTDIPDQRKIINGQIINPKTLNPEQQLEEKEFRTFARKLINQLPHDEQVILQMKWEGFLFNEIGQTLNIKENTACIKYHRAVRKIIKHLEESGGLI